MADERSIHARFVDELHDVLEFALAILADPTDIGEAFGVLIDPSPVAEAREKLERLEAFEDTDDGIPANLLKIGDAAARLVEVAELIKLSAQGGDEEAGRSLLDALAITYFEERVPLLVHTARLLGFVDDQIHFDRLNAFLRDVGSYLEDNFDGSLKTMQTDADARRQSLLLGVLAAAAWLIQWRVRENHTFEPEKGSAFDIEVLHGWEPTFGLDTPLADAVSERMLSLAVRLGALGGEESAAVALLATFALVPADHGGPGLWGTFALQQEVDVRLTDDGWYFSANLPLGDFVDWYLPFAGGGERILRSGSFSGVEAEARYERRDDPASGEAAKPWRLPGFEARHASVVFRIAQSGPFLQLRLRDAAFVLEPGSDSWLGAVLPEGARVDFDVGIGLTDEPAIVFEGGSGLRALIPVSRHCGPVHLQSVTVELVPGPEGSKQIALEATAGLSLHFGKDASVIAEGLGAALRWDGTLPPEDRFTVDALLPQRLGVSINAPAAKGGGFLFHDRERRQYGGVVELTFKKLAFKGYGLLTEREGGGRSLIVVLSLECAMPAVGFGFRLAGGGGLLGLHHRLDADALQAAVRSGGAGELLFPRDPVANAPRILSTLGSVFPPAPDQFVFGPMLKFVWGTESLFELSVALVFEAPSPVRMLILGKLVVTAPHEKHALLLLRADFAGILDFDRPSFEFDASLVGSRLGPWPVTGDISARVGGDVSGLLITVGGFHPRFPVPAELNLPKLRRIAIALSSDDNPRARLEFYTAIVPGSWQLGGKLEIVATAGGFSAEALVSLDAVFGEVRLQGEEPRSGFVAELQARAVIRYHGSTLAGVDLRLTATGTEPWTFKGGATLSLFLFSVTIPIDYCSGARAVQAVIDIVDAAGELLRALEDEQSWETALPADAPPLVTLTGRAAGEGASAAHPLGRLAVRQFSVPLGIELTRVGGARATPDRFDLGPVVVEGAATAPEHLRGLFAAGQFLDLEEDEALSRPSFEPMISGFAVGGAEAAFGPVEEADLRYEEILIGPDGPLEEPRPGRPAVRGVLAHALSLSVAATSVLRGDEAPDRLRAGVEPVVVADVAPALVDADTLRPVEVPGLAGALTHTEVAQALARHLASGAAAPRTLSLVGAHEALDG